MQHAHAHLVVADLFHRLNDGLGGTLHVGFHQNGQFADILVGLRVRHKLIKRDRSTSCSTFVLGGFLAIFSNFTRLRFSFNNVQNIASFRSTVQTEHLNRNRRSSFFDSFAVVIFHRTDTAPLLAHDEDIALAKRTVLYKNRRDWATAHIQLSFDDCTGSGAVRVRFQLKNFRLKRDRFQQFFQAGSVDSRNLNVLHFARHLLHDHLVLQQVSAHLIRISLRAVDFVNRHDHRHFGRFRMINRLDRLRHHSVICCNHKHHDIRHLSTASTHRRKRGVAGCIKERQLVAILLDLIGADVLRDAASLTGNNLGIPDRVEK